MGLCITRKAGQGVKMTGESKVFVTRCGVRSVRLRIEAPAGTKIVRMELEEEASDERHTDSTPERQPEHNC
jgi:sRNA-binding carbon storage regulator CsrA